MDATSIIIIIIATVLAIVFKVVLYKKIQRWMDQDLIKGLSENKPEKQKFLEQKYDELVKNKIKRKEYPDRLTDSADEFEQNNS